MMYKVLKCVFYTWTAPHHFETLTCNAVSSKNLAHTIQTEIQDLIVQFADIVEDLKQLPPSRPGFDSKIPLQEGSGPLILRPYGSP